MNCRDIEPLLLVERDGVLTLKQHAALAAHVAACPACRLLRTTYGEAVTFLKTDAANVTVPDADQEWRTLRAQLRGETAKPAKKRPLAPIIWFSAPLATAAMLALAFFVTRPSTTQTPSLALQATVESGETAVSTIAYVDKDSGWLVVWATEADPKSSG